MINRGKKLIIGMVAAVAAVWLVHAAVDVFVFRKGTLLGHLTFKVPIQELYFRLFFILCFLILGSAIFLIVRKRNQAENRLKTQSAAVEASMDGIAIYNSADELVYVNQAYALINGFENPKEIVGTTCAQNYGEQEFERMQHSIMPILQKNRRWRGELLARRKNGSTYFQEASVTMLDDGGRVCIVRDITWRKRSEERLQRSERFLNMIFNSIRDPFCIFDSDFRIIRVNEAYAQLKNKTFSDLIGRKCYEVLEGRRTFCEGCVVGKTFNSGDPCAKDKLVTLQDGAGIWVEIYTYPILDESGRVSHVIEYTRDVTERKKAEDEKRRLIERLEHLSRTDGLTGLMNRRALTDSLTYEIDRAKRYRSELSVILCDIDNFKEINDTYGHDAGDRALQMLTATLNTILRKTDMAGRYGGDEFMLILPQTSLEGAEYLAEKILAAVRNEDLCFEPGRCVRLTMSVGIVRMTGERESIDSLIKRADDAMYASKQSGRNRASTVKS